MVSLKALSKNFSTLAFATSVCVLLNSCGSNKSENQEETADTTTAEVSAPATKTNVFYNIPSPIQLGKLLKKAGATYDKKVLNAQDNVSKYSTTTSKAINLGVYGADMSYSAIFGQTQECLSYLDCSKKLADELGSSAAYANEVIKKLKANSGNQDSLLSMISDIFLNSNETFKENDQVTTFLLATSGGFIEGLYVGTQVAKNIKNNAEVITRIAELKGSLNNLIGLLKTQESNADISAMITDLTQIQAIYDETKSENNAPSVKADTVKNIITIGGSSNYSLSKEQLDRITATAETLRNKITKP